MASIRELALLTALDSMIQHWEKHHPDDKCDCKWDRECPTAEDVEGACVVCRCRITSAKANREIHVEATMELLRKIFKEASERIAASSA